MNPSVFSKPGRQLPSADTTNLARGKAYSMSAEHALAQLATTGCIADTFYQKAEAQLKVLLDLVPQTDCAFLTRLAFYARDVGHMKDMPALLAAILTVASKKDPNIRPYARLCYKLVIKNGRMLRNYVQALRSGAIHGNKSLGSFASGMIADTIYEASDIQLVRWSVGNDPSLADIIKMVHPNPPTDERRHLHAWLLKQEPKEEWPCPSIVREIESFRNDPNDTISVPKGVPSRLFTGMKLNKRHWTEIADNAGYMETRMNLAAWAEQGVFDDPIVTSKIASRLEDPEELIRAKQFPFQLYVAAAMTRANTKIPTIVRDAMENAVDLSFSLLPAYEGNVVVLTDISVSMSAKATGAKQSTASCVDVAAVFTSGILQKNRDARVLVFNNAVMDITRTLHARDTAVSNALKIRGLLNGGTDIGNAMQAVAQLTPTPDLVIMLSDNESWMDNPNRYRGSCATNAANAWNAIWRRNKKAKLICIDLAPNTTMQVSERPGVTNIGGFSDEIFQLIADIQQGIVQDADLWIKKIKAIDLPLTF